MTDHTAALKEAATKYRRAIEHANELQRQASEVQKEASAALAETMRNAYAGGSGMKKAEILRATDHVWSRTWLDNAVKPEATDS